MKQDYVKKRLSFNRKMVAASMCVSKEKNNIDSLFEVDVMKPRNMLREYKKNNGESLSFTAYIVKCLAETMKEFPDFNSFIKSGNLITFDDVTISVLVERELKGEKVPEPIGISGAQSKSFREIHEEIRDAQTAKGDELGNLAGLEWVRFIPGFLMRSFIRLASKNIKMQKKYGVVAVTAVGMFCDHAAWFIPVSSATVALTVGGIGMRDEKEYLSLTLTVDHDIVDGAPMARFVSKLSNLLQSGTLISS